MSEYYSTIWKMANITFSVVLKWKSIDLRLGRGWRSSASGPRGIFLFFLR